MQKLLILVGIATAVLCKANVLPVDNHQLPSGNLKDYLYWNAFSDVNAYLYKCQDGAVPYYDPYINGTYISYNCVYIYSEINATLVYTLDFGTSETATSINLGLAASYPAGVVTEINIYVDSKSSTPISTLYLTDTGYPFEYTFINATSKVTATPTGIHDVYFTFTSSNQDHCLFDWFRFNV